MLRNLKIKNLILVESCEIEFSGGFTVISGETGAGKTVILEALALALGERADTDTIRRGEEKAVVEAVFDFFPAILLEECGIDPSDDGTLVVRREIATEGKGKAFLNFQAVPLHVLQKIGRQLVEHVGQHAVPLLKSAETQRGLLDQYGSLQPLLTTFQTLYADHTAREREIADLAAQSSNKEREQTKVVDQLAEIEEANIREGEAETVFEEYSRLSSAQESCGALHALLQHCSTVAAPLARMRALFGSLPHTDEELKEAAALTETAQIGLTEVARTLASTLPKFEANPKRLEFLEARLKVIDQMGRRFGKSFEELKSAKQALEARRDALAEIDEKLAALREKQEHEGEKLSDFAQTITTKRKTAAKQLQEKLTALLRQLNMEGASIQIGIAPAPLTSHGTDQIQFLLQANTGEAALPIEEGASGGELSRILFALKVILAEKNNTFTLVFDEIDANIGGATAGLIGDQLKTLGEKRQVLAITHFPQAASKADTHLHVYKEETTGRTLSHIVTLDPSQRSQELLRMIGGNTILDSYKTAWHTNQHEQE
jgi:DNA repair protein RecN (Recombination protein N)